MAQRVIRIMSGTVRPPVEFGRVIWDGDRVNVTGPPLLLDDFADGVGDDFLTPEAGEPFLDALLNEYDGSLVWAEEVGPEN